MSDCAKELDVPNPEEVRCLLPPGTYTVRCARGCEGCQIRKTVVIPEDEEVSDDAGD